MKKYLFLFFKKLRYDHLTIHILAWFMLFSTIEGSSQSYYKNKSYKRKGKNKAVEFNAYRTNHIINVDFNYRPVGDHAGVRIMLGLFGYDVELYFYDCRHWDHKTGTWELV